MNKETSNPFDVIMETGVDFEVTPCKPIFLQKWGFARAGKRFMIYPICMGSLLTIAKAVSDIEKLDMAEIDGETFFETAIAKILENTELIVRVLSLAVFNKDLSINRFVRFFQERKIKRLAAYFKRNLDSKELFQLINLVIQQMRIDEYLSMMVAMKGIVLMPETVTKKEQ